MIRVHIGAIDDNFCFIFYRLLLTRGTRLCDRLECEMGPAVSPLSHHVCVRIVLAVPRVAPQSDRGLAPRPAPPTQGLPEFVGKEAIFGLLACSTCFYTHLIMKRVLVMAA